MAANTSGFAGGYVQCNVVILPAQWATDFMQFCQLNPRPCPLIASSSTPSDTALPALGDIDIRKDVFTYRVYKHGELKREVNDITTLWQDDFVAFALGCSFSFEEALTADGLKVRNIAEGQNVPMYKTNIACASAGKFSGHMVVSMRPFVASDAIRAVQICTRFPSVHGVPIHIGDPKLIGIGNIDQPDYGDTVSIHENELPVFWTCGVTPQAALERAKPPICITHSPGCMLVTDIANSKLSIM